MIVWVVCHKFKDYKKDEVLKERVLKEVWANNSVDVNFLGKFTKKRHQKYNPWIDKEMQSYLRMMIYGPSIVYWETEPQRLLEKLKASIIWK